MAADNPDTTAPVSPAGAPLPLADAYELVRDDIRRLLAGAPRHQDTVVPACPEWTVRQTVAHLTGNCLTARASTTGGGARPAAGVMPPPQGAPDPEWTRRQVAGLAGSSLADLLAAWEEAASELAPRIRRGEFTANRLVMDAITHRFDLGVAVGEPPPREHPLLVNALSFLAGGFFGQAAGRGFPPLRLRETGTGAEWHTPRAAGTGEAGTGAAGTAEAGTLSAGRYDLARSLSGRRTPRQIAALEWDTDPGPWLPAFQWGPFVPPTEPVE